MSRVLLSQSAQTSASFPALRVAGRLCRRLDQVRPLAFRFMTGSTTDGGELERNKQVVRRLIKEVMNDGRLDVIDELYDPRLAPAAHRWIEPFLKSFSDIHMRIDQLVAEGDSVVGRFSCSAIHTGSWLGHQPTGRRFTNIAEVYIFRIRAGRITSAWGLEDTYERLRQLGLLAHA